MGGALLGPQVACLALSPPGSLGPAGRHPLHHSTAVALSTEEEHRAGPRASSQPALGPFVGEEMMSLPFVLPVSLGRVRSVVLEMGQTGGLPLGCEALSWLCCLPPWGPSSGPLPSTSTALSVGVHGLLPAAFTGLVLSHLQVSAQTVPPPPRPPTLFQPAEPGCVSVLQRGKRRP